MKIELTSQEFADYVQGSQYAEGWSDEELMTLAEGVDQMLEECGDESAHCPTDYLINATNQTATEVAGQYDLKSTSEKAICAFLTENTIVWGTLHIGGRTIFIYEMF